MGHSKIVRASAGSGKTFRLVAEYLAALVDQPDAYRHTLAVTFTNKATGEMKERIVQQLGALSSGAQTPYLDVLSRTCGLDREQVRKRAGRAMGMILHDYSRLAVVTIDKFFQNIIRSFLRELGVSPDFAIELRTDTLLEQAADALVELSALDGALEEWIGAFADEQMEQGVGWDVRGKLAAAGGELFGERGAHAAGREAGREALGRAVGQAVAHCDATMERIRSLARRAMELIRENGLSVDDFHYRARGIAGFLARTAGGQIEDYASISYVAATLAGERPWVGAKSAARRAVEALQPRLEVLLREIAETWDRERKTLNTTALVRRRWRSFGLLEDISRQVDRLAAEGNVMPIARTNELLGELIAGNDIPFVFEKAGERFTRFLIDEFQDTSRGQWENFVPLLLNAVSQNEGQSVLLVGDQKQSIYRWRGGDWQILASGAERALGEVSVESLDENRRSLERVVEFNNSLMALCVECDTRALDELLGGAQGDGYLTSEKREELLALLPGAYLGHRQRPMPENAGGYVTVRLEKNPAAAGRAGGATERGAEGSDEAILGADDAVPPTDPIIARVEDLQSRGFAPSDIAILVRRRSEARAVAQLLLDRKAAAPHSPYSYDVVTAEALAVGSSPTVRFLVACLRLSVDPSHGESRALWALRAGNPPHGQLPPGERDFLHSIRLSPPVEALQKLLIRHDVGADTASVAYVQAFQQQLLDYCNDNVADIALFLKWWEREGAGEPVYMPESRSAISVITVHASKGLERRAVIVPFCSWPLAPKSGSTMWVDATGTPFEKAGSVAIGYEKAAAKSFFSQEYYTETALSHVDNVNLLYVALTRAREELHIHVPARRGSPPAQPVTVGDLLTAALRAGGGIAGAVARDDETATVVEFGSPVRGQSLSALRDERLAVGFPSREAGLRLRLRLPWSRYGGREATERLSARDYGVAMHRVFGGARTVEDLWEALRALRGDGLLSARQELHVEQLIRRALQDGRIASWFDPEWEVRNENDILVPGRGNSRPDRVMTLGERAVVVDYKFGRGQSPAHRTQIEGYMSLLRRMGYTRTEGWLWYVSLGEVVEVGG